MNESFKVDGVSYPITPIVYQCLQNYLAEKNNVSWVEIDAPYIRYGLKLDTGDEKQIKIRASSFLKNNEIAEEVSKIAFSD